MKTVFCLLVLCLFSLNAYAGKRSTLYCESPLRKLCYYVSPSYGKKLIIYGKTYPIEASKRYSLYRQPVTINSEYMFDKIDIAQGVFVTRTYRYTKNKQYEFRLTQIHKVQNNGTQKCLAVDLKDVQIPQADINLGTIRLIDVMLFKESH